MSVYGAAQTAQNEVSNVRNSDALALELIDMLGVEGARRMCREHCWDGVANAVERVSRETPKTS
jgi:hypothetical protein